VPVTYVDKCVQEMPVQVKGIYTNDPNILLTCGHFIENSREQFFLIEEGCVVASLLLLLLKYQQQGIASIAIPESAWLLAQHTIGEEDVPSTLEMFVCKGE
jgi:hypothetical protein